MCITECTPPAISYEVLRHGWKTWVWGVDSNFKYFFPHGDAKYELFSNLLKITKKTMHLRKVVCQNV
jgi:hypothetical protein